MEIERKFLITEFPSNLKLIDQAKIEQGYISIDPEVRIRSQYKNGDYTYKLCFKGNGTLSREEIELDLTEDKFNKLIKLIQKDMIIKEYKVFDLDGFKLECNYVDKGKSTEFLYAEIEFENEEQANNFIPLKDFKDVTEDLSWKMKNYWSRTRV